MKLPITLFCALAFASLLAAQPNQPVPKAQVIEISDPQAEITGNQLEKPSRKPTL